MNVLPEEIAVVDSNLQVLRRLRRTDAGALREADFDQLIATQADTIASALQSAEILDHDCKLRVLAQKQQVAKIDVLLAEVIGDEIARLVLVETKLFRHPESRRTVLAQLLEYANTLQFDVSVDEILSKADGPTREWLEDRRDELEHVKARGDFLLVICGDRVHPRLAEMAKPMLDRRRHVLSGLELVLVSLAIYGDEQTKLVVPNLVGAVTRGQRDLCIEVTVRTEEGKVVPATVSERGVDARATPTRGPKSPWDAERFLAEVERAVAEEGPSEPTWGPAIREVLAFAQTTPGLRVRWGAGRSGTFHVDVEGPGSQVKVAWFDTCAWVSLHRAAFAEVLGEERATQRVAELAKSLEIIDHVKSSGHTPALGTSDAYFDIREPKELSTFFRWLIEMRDEIVAALKADSKG